MTTSLLKANYYDQPEGEDYIGKMAFTNKVAVQFALGAGLADVIMVTKPKGYIPTISRFMWWLGPAMGMASAFTTGTYISAHLRGKDDKINYCVGACGAAGVFGAWQRSAVVGFSMCLVFSIAAAVKKLSIEEGWIFFPTDIIDTHVWTGSNPRKYDFTLTPEGEKGWTTGKE